MDWEAGNVYVRPNHMRKAGDVIDGHGHNFGHLSIIMLGGVRVEREDGKVRDFYAAASNLTSDDPMWMRQCAVYIEAGMKHKITALVDDTVFWCVYAHRNAQGDVVQEMTPWGEANPYV